MIERAVILSTGDEITTGKVVDSNSNYLADKLSEIGIDLIAVLTVGDVPGAPGMGVAIRDGTGRRGALDWRDRTDGGRL